MSLPHSSKLAMPSTSSRAKRNSRDREKRKSQSGLAKSNNNVPVVEKNLRLKENPWEYAGISSEPLRLYPKPPCEEYAGISPESIRLYSKQSCEEQLSDAVCNLLVEDVNYKLRYIIHDALIRAQLSGQNSIQADDIEDVFENLQIEKVYGIPDDPNWVPVGDQNFLQLEDEEISLWDMVDHPPSSVQPGDVQVTKEWLPEDLSTNQTYKNYFKTVCQLVVDNDEELRQAALVDISQNPQAGIMVEWFYNFAYLMLSKDITYDSLTLYALDLIETLENSPLHGPNAHTKQLNLLTRLLLQRLLVSKTTEEVLKPMCDVLATLCLRKPLRDLVITKILQKIITIQDTFAQPILMIINALGVETINQIFVPNMDYFFNKVEQKWEAGLIYPILGIYSLVCKSELHNEIIHKCFYETFGPNLLMFWKHIPGKIVPVKHEKNIVKMRSQLIKTRRKVNWNGRKEKYKYSLDEVFDLPTKNCKVTQKLNQHEVKCGNIKDTRIVIGRTSLLLPVFKKRMNGGGLLPGYSECYVFGYNL